MSPMPSRSRPLADRFDSLIRLFSCLVLPGLLHAASPDPAQPPKPYPSHLQWWADARFGMFVHWGPVSLTGQEIGWARGAQIPIEEYDRLYTRFNPTHFDARAWARTARDAGMKYLVFTSKHHDGFCMWDTRQTDHNIMRSPFGRDVIKELSEACREIGIRFGTYYSTCDWHHPDFPLTSPGGTVRRPTSNLDRYERYLRAQVRELITRYGPLGILWFDVPQEFNQARGQGVLDFVRSLQPDIIVNNRSGAPGDYDTPEQRVGKYQDHRPWETCMTICQQWAWKPNDDMKSLAQCLQTLILCAGGDGNLLFNVGPTPDGLIEPRQVARLREMGDWLDRHGESLRNTRGGPWKPTRTLASTRRGNVAYIHHLRPDTTRLELPDLPRRLRSATRPGGGPVVARQERGLLQLDLGSAPLDPIDTIVRLEFDGSLMDLPAVSTRAGLTPRASASNVFQQLTAEYGPDEAFDQDDETRWATDAGTRQAWIAADLGKPTAIGRVHIHEALQERIRKFEFQYRDGSTWKTLFDGQRIGPSFDRSFPPVTAREFRLNILDATEGPTLHEIELLPE